MKKVLHNRDRDTSNTVILLTDGLPTDKLDALHLAALIKKNKVDYNQVIFKIKEEQRNEIEYTGSKPNSVATDNIVFDITEGMVEKVLTDKELDYKLKGLYNDFTKIAETCGGNQIILKINKLIKVVTVECYDKYLGMLTLANPK